MKQKPRLEHFFFGNLWNHDVYLFELQAVAPDTQHKREGRISESFQALIFIINFNMPSLQQVNGQ